MSHEFKTILLRELFRHHLTRLYGLPSNSIIVVLVEEIIRLLLRDNRHINKSITSTTKSIIRIRHNRGRTSHLLIEDIAFPYIRKGVARTHGSEASIWVNIRSHDAKIYAALHGVAVHDIAREQLHRSHHCTHTSRFLILKNCYVNLADNFEGATPTFDLPGQLFIVRHACTD